MNKIKLLLTEIYNLTRDLTFLVKNNDVPVISLDRELHPEDVHITWQKVNFESTQKQTVFISNTPEQRNFKCTKCKERISGIRSFYKKGRKPVLVLTYSGEIRAGKRMFTKKSILFYLKLMKHNHFL